MDARAVGDVRLNALWRRRKDDDDDDNMIDDEDDAVFSKFCESASREDGEMFAIGTDVKLVVSCCENLWCQLKCSVATPTACSIMTLLLSKNSDGPHSPSLVSGTLLVMHLCKYERHWRWGVDRSVLLYCKNDRD